MAYCTDCDTDVDLTTGGRCASCGGGRTLVECDCADRAPVNVYWICPKCDTEWHPVDDE